MNAQSMIEKREPSKLETAMEVFHRLATTSEANMNETDKAMYHLACKVIREHLEA